MILKIGDQVVLNSGGPVMTVEKVDGDRVICSWDAGKECAFFKPQMLTRAR